MKSFLFFFCILFQLSIYGQQPQSYVSNSLFVKLKPQFNRVNSSSAEKFNIPQLQQLNRQHSLGEVKLSGNRKSKDTYVLYFQNEEDIKEIKEAYIQTGLFEYVSLNMIGFAGGECFEVLNTTPNDALYERQWGLNNDGSFPISPAESGVDIRMEEAWDVEQGLSGLVIAVLDSGAKIDHPELSGRLWINQNETIDGIDNDNNGYIDDVNGWDFANSDNNPTDDVGHGTNIIGIIGSNADNSTAYAGINWNSTIMNIKMLDANNAYIDGAWAVDAIYYAVDNGANIINMSWGGPSFPPLEDAITYAANNGVILVAAMMNFDNNVPYYPAAYPQTIAVGSIDPDGDRSSPFYWSPTSGSNYGSHIDLIAPGNYIYNITHTSNTNYNIYWGGTSQATPHVTGIASLLLSQNPNSTPEEIRTILNSTADDLTGNPAEDTSGFDIYYGHGRLNAARALNSVLSVEENIENNFSLYPNPISNTGEVTIKSKSQDIDTLTIYDVLGAKVFEDFNLTTTYTFPISNLKSGVYLVSLQSKKSNITQVKKLVIK